MTTLAGFSGGKRVVVVTDSKRGPTATQMISFWQPFEGAHGHDGAHIIFENDHSTASDIEQAFAVHDPDLLVLSRYSSERGPDWARLARAVGIPVLFHIDDDLLAVPSSVGEAKFAAYNRPERLQALRANIEASDLCYVSTSELARRLEEHGVRTPIVSGRIYCSVSPDQIGPLIPPATGPVIGYMGTGGHSADLAMIMPAVCDVMEAVPSLQFEVFGTIEMPNELAQFGRRARHLPPVADYGDFLAYLRSLGWWIGLAPLEDNAFNRCKADTKWVEYSAAGMAVVASDLPVYQSAFADGAAILAGTTAEWTSAMMTLIHRPNFREAMIDKAKARLRESYTHEMLRHQVMGVFDKAAARAKH